MTANLLTLNSSKTEFLLIGLKQQLAKINNSSLNTTHSARNLGFIFDKHLTISDQIVTLMLKILILPLNFSKTDLSSNLAFLDKFPALERLLLNRKMQIKKPCQLKPF